MKFHTKCIKRYVIQHCDDTSETWYDVKCKYNGRYVQIISGFEGSDVKPTREDLDDAKMTVSNFSDSMFRIVEKTIVIIEEFDKTRVR